MAGRPLALVDATPLQSEHRLRGVGTYVRHLCLALAEIAPDEVRFAAEVRGRALLPLAVRRLSVFGLRPHRPAQVYWLPNEWFLRGLQRRVRPLVFHATDFNGAVRRPGTRLVTTLYDLIWLKQGRRGTGLSDRLADLRWTVYFRHKLPRADLVLAVSESVRRDALELLGLPPDRVVTVPLGVDTTRFHAGVAPGRFADAPPYLLFLGGPDPNKNLSRVLEAFARVRPEHPDVWFYVAGPWPPPAAEALLQTCRRLQLAERVTLLGYVPSEELPALYARAVALIFPSLDEGFGLPILEAMACGTPVLSSDRAATRETAGDAALLVDPTDTGALAAAMTRLIEEERLREHLRSKGRARAATFSWRRVAERTLTLYRDCARL